MRSLLRDLPAVIIQIFPALCQQFLPPRAPAPWLPITLAQCLVCGYVGCCDTSKKEHMHQHVQETDHQLIRSIEPGEGWIWCYEDNAVFQKRTLERIAADLGQAV